MAAAYLDKYRQTVFALYNAADGSRVPCLTAMSGAIRSVAFSKDGRLVVSASEDQTVSVWSLTKIDMVLGKAGRVPGLAVQFKDGKLLVTAAGADSPLKKGNLIDKVTVAGKVVPFTKELDFYLAVYKDVAPGNSFTVSVDGKNVELKTVQGVDERKPLLSLFVKKTTKAEDKPEDMTWIGWNPAGPYEVSSAAAEEYLGWHFNTGKADNPTSFAKIGEYKKDHEKKGILKHLVKQGSLCAGPGRTQKGGGSEAAHETRRRICDCRHPCRRTEGPRPPAGSPARLDAAAYSPKRVPGGSHRLDPMADQARRRDV